MGYNTPPRWSYLPTELMTAGEPVVALSPRKVRPQTNDSTTGGLTVRHAAEHLNRELNSTGRLCVPIRLPLNGFTYS